MDNNVRGTVRRTELEQYITDQAMRNIRALMNGEITFNVFAINIEWINQQHRAALRYSRMHVRGRLQFNSRSYFEYLQMMNDNVINELVEHEQQAQQQQQLNANNIAIPIEIPMDVNVAAANNHNAAPERQNMQPNEIENHLFDENNNMPEANATGLSRVLEGIRVTSRANSHIDRRRIISEKARAPTLA